jgi:ABC-type multidrug transport system fused ATPase/permease subunit
MLIRLALWMIFLCLPLFLLAKMLLVFTFIIVAAFATQFATFLLLAAFGLLVFGGFVNVIKHIFNVMRHYFSAEQSENRQFLFVKNKQSNQKRLFHFKRLQLNYFKERQQKRLLEKNNREQINALSAAIERDLQRIKHTISKDIFSQFQLENQRYRKQQNGQSLLELHHKIANFTGK